MAETTKLAGRFTAWRLTVGVKPEDLSDAIKRCVNLGLLPEVRGYDAGCGWVLFRVLVPNMHNESSCSQSFKEEMAVFHGALVHGVKAELICPPSASGATAKPEFKVWRTIKLGIGPKNADDFRKAIKDCGMKIGDLANDILGEPEFTVATGETEVDLVKVTVAELGFKEGVRRDQIYDRAKEFGLELCLSEVGPQLRLQYKDQPNGEWILIGMEPIRRSDGDLRVFRVEHIDYGQWLLSDYGGPDGVWSAGARWVFVRPRK